MATDLKILIAEDECHISLALKTIIRKAFPLTSVNIVKNGREALDTIKVTNYQLIISDWNMPVMSGIELLSALRNKKATMGIPFIMLTARGDKGSVMSAAKNGVTEYVSKPFENRQIIEKVGKSLGYCNPIPEDTVKMKTDMVVDDDIDSLFEDLLENYIED